jgi:hypothetical protein
LITPRPGFSIHWQQPGSRRSKEYFIKTAHERTVMGGLLLSLHLSELTTSGKDPTIG